MIYLFYLLILVQYSHEPQRRQVNFNFHQSDYKVRFERAEAVRYNKLFVDHFRVVTFKYNRSCAAVNVSLNYKIDKVSDIEIIFQAYKFSSNEYRLFPLRMQINFCEVFKNDIAGLASFSECRNFVGCPSQKGKDYQLCNFAPNSTKLPPFIPNGSYMLEVQALYRSNETWFGKIYAEISRPIVEAYLYC